MTVRWNGQALLQKARRGAVQGVVAGAAIVDEESVRRIQEEDKTGRVYNRGGRSHQASAPGQAPASDTGRLLGSRNTEIEDDGLVARVSYNTEYARRLEMGDEDFEPRPYLRVALEAKRDEVEETVQSFIRDELVR